MSPVSRRELLDVGHEVEKLQARLQDLQDWAQGLQAEMTMQATPCSPVRILYMLEEHQAYKVELDIRADSLDLVRSVGQRLLASGYPLASGIRQPLATVEQELSSLQESWQGRQQQLQQALEQQVGRRPASSLPCYQDLRCPHSSGQSQS